MSETTPEPGWYPDPERPSAQRWWDGTAWAASGTLPPPSGVMPQPKTRGRGQPKASGKKKGRGCITGLATIAVLVVVIVIIAAAVGSSKKSSPSTPSAPGATTGSSPRSGIAGDVVTGDCSVDGSGFPHASVTVTNHSAKASMYIYFVEFDDAAGKRLANGSGSQQQVLPGQSAHDDVMGDAQLSPGAAVTCRPYNVNRIAA